MTIQFAEELNKMIARDSQRDYHFLQVVIEGYLQLPAYNKRLQAQMLLLSALIDELSKKREVE